MSNDSEKKYIYLNDSVAKEDSFNTHTRVAESMKYLIEKDEGHTVALKGGWGSGKSSVLEQLKDKLDNNIHIFTFDAWEFEGGYLQQAFLYKFIEWIKHKFYSSSSYEEKKKVLSKTQDEVMQKARTTIRNTEPASPIQFGWLIWLVALLSLIPTLFAVLGSSIESYAKWILGETIGTIIFLSAIMLLISDKKKGLASRIINTFWIGFAFLLTIPLNITPPECFNRYIE